jgi:hypothetical protein
MKKENIYVEITNEQERLRAINILQNAGEKIWEDYASMTFSKSKKYLCIDKQDKDWWIQRKKETQYIQITLDELESLLNPKKSNVFTDVQEWIRENMPNVTYTFQGDETPDCFKRLEQHLKNDYPKGTEIKISANEILISNK